MDIAAIEIGAFLEDWKHYLVAVRYFLNIQIAAVGPVVDGQHPACDRGDADDTDHRFGFKLQRVTPMDNPLFDPDVAILYPELLAPDPIGEDANAGPKGGESEPMDADLDDLNGQHIARLCATNPDRSGCRVAEGQRHVGRLELFIERVNQVAADVELGFDLESLAGADLSNERIG